MLKYTPHLKSFLSKKNVADLTYFLTNNCNASCKQCFFHTHLNETAHYLDLNEIEQIFRNLNLLTRVLLSGGEPFLHKNIKEIITIIHQQSGAIIIKVPTNGTLTEKIINDIEFVLKHCPKLTLDIGISLDEIGEKRDEIMGIPGSFTKSINTFKKLKQLKLKYKNLIVGVIITQMKSNEDRIEEVYNYALEWLKVDNISYAAARGDALEKEQLEINLDIYKKMVAKLESNSCQTKNIIHKIYNYQRNRAYRNTIKSREQNKQVIPCLSGQIKVVLMPNGDVYPCEQFMLTKPDNFKFGNLRDFKLNIYKMFDTDHAKSIVQFIKQKKCWCCNECDISVSTFYNLNIFS